MEARSPLIEVKLATRIVDGVSEFCSELYLSHRFAHASDWTPHPADAIRDGEDMKAAAFSEWALAEARREAAALFAA